MEMKKYQPLVKGQKGLTEKGTEERDMPSSPTFLDGHDGNGALFFFQLKRREEEKKDEKMMNRKNSGA